MAIVLRIVKGEELTIPEIDGNFIDLDGRLAALETAFSVNPAIEDFEVIGSDFYVLMSDATVLGPYPLPVVTPNPRGEWTPFTSYSKYDWVHFEGATYQILFNHTSAASFDPGAESGGYDLYEVMVPAPDIFAPPVITETLSAFQHSLTKANKYVRCTHIDGATITIEPDATINHETASEATYVQRGGPLVVAAGIGVTLNWPDGFIPETNTLGAWVIIKKYAANAWDLTGGPLLPEPT